MGAEWFPKGFDPLNVSMVLVAEGLPEEMADYFYGDNLNSLYIVNTLEAFRRAGAQVEDMEDLLARGIYLTVAVRDVRRDPTFPAKTIKEHSQVLEEELARFPNLQAVLLMGDAAIKAINHIAKRQGAERVIPAGSTYKIRGEPYYWGKVRAFPSYLQTGKNFLIEKSKQSMVVDDIKQALALVSG